MWVAKMISMMSITAALASCITINDYDVNQGQVSHCL